MESKDELKYKLKNANAATTTANQKIEEIKILLAVRYEQYGTLYYYVYCYVRCTILYNVLHCHDLKIFVFYMIVSYCIIVLSLLYGMAMYCIVLYCIVLF